MGSMELSGGQEGDRLPDPVDGFPFPQEFQHVEQAGALSPAGDRYPHRMEHGAVLDPPSDSQRLARLFGGRRRERVEGFEGLDRFFQEGRDIRLAEDFFDGLRIVRNFLQKNIDPFGDVGQQFDLLLFQGDHLFQFRTHRFHVSLDQSGVPEEGQGPLGQFPDGHLADVFPVHPFQFLGIEGGGALDATIDGELLYQFIEREQVLTVLGGPAQQGQIVPECFRQISLLLVFLHGGGAVAF